MSDNSEIELKRDQLISELMLRMSSLEGLLMKRGHLTEKEITEAYLEATQKFLNKLKELTDAEAKANESGTVH